MVKLQRHKAYTYKAESGKNIEHFKYLVNVPESALSDLGWHEGQELSFTVSNDSLILKPDAGVKERDKLVRRAKKKNE